MREAAELDLDLDLDRGTEGEGCATPVTEGARERCWIEGLREGVDGSDRVQWGVIRGLPPDWFKI